MQIKKSSKILFSLILCLLLMSIMTGCQKQSADFKYDSNRPKTEDGFDLAIKERDKNSHEADNAETENSEEETTDSSKAESTSKPAETSKPTEKQTTPTTTKDDSPYPIKNVKISDYLNARSNPDMDSIITYVISPQDEFSIISEDSDWYLVERGEEQAYVAKDVLDAIRTE